MNQLVYLSTLACLLLAATTCAQAFSLRSDATANGPDDLTEMPVAAFPHMSAWQRCLFVCSFCFRGEGKESDLLSCANSWCLESLGKTGVLPKVAVQMCPAMSLV